LCNNIMVIIPRHGAVVFNCYGLRLGSNSSMTLSAFSLVGLGPLQQIRHQTLIATTHAHGHYHCSLLNICLFSTIPTWLRTRVRRTKLLDAYILSRVTNITTNMRLSPQLDPTKLRVPSCSPILAGSCRLTK
jgi:hypothetical protein